MTKKTKTKRRPGKPKKRLTPREIKDFLHAISLGAPTRDACMYSGISETWFYAEKHRLTSGDPDNPPTEEYRELWAGFKKAFGAASVEWLGDLAAASKSGVWTASAWRLERTRGMAQRVKTEGEINVNASVTIEDSRTKLMDKLACIANRLEKGSDS